MIPLVIVGAGSAGTLYRQIVADINAEKPTYDFLGFLDDHKTGDEIIGKTDELRTTYRAAQYVIGMNWSRHRASYAVRYGAKNAATLVHPTAMVGSDVAIGAGSVIGPYVCIPCNVSLGDSSHLNVGSSVHQGTGASFFLTLAPGARICGDCKIGQLVEVGANAVVAHGRTVGDCVRIGAGSAVMTDVESNTTVGGVPARRIA